MARFYLVRKLQIMYIESDNFFSKAMLTGLFIGIVDTLICLAYNIGYRDVTGYIPSAIINVSSLIFGVNLLLLVIGMLYFVFFKIFGRRDYVFILTILALTAFFVWKTDTGHRFADGLQNGQWKGLLGGILLILGASAVSLPFCLRSRFFEKYVL
jgi:hypothetical protein